MAIFSTVLIVIAFVSAAWFWFEGRWDRRLFSNAPGRICENLRSRGALELLQSREDVQVIDVRSASEFAQGALPRATNLSSGAADFSQRLAELDRTKPLLVYCAGGYRSRKAVETLRMLGFESIHHLHRGYHAWRLAGMPTCKPKNGSPPHTVAQ